MKDGFIRVCAATPDVRVADCEYNTENIIEIIKKAAENNAKLVVFPELCVTAYTCGDLFNQKALREKAKESLARIVEETAQFDIISVVGMPLEVNQKLYNTAVAVKGGSILGIVPKSNIPNYSEFYEMRNFESAPKGVKNVFVCGQDVPFGTDILFCCENYPEFVLALEICEDVWVPNSPSVRHTSAGATVIANLSASDELAGKDEYRKLLIRSQSARLISAYVYADAGEGESTSDLVFSGENIIAENGIMLNVSKRFENGVIYAETDVQKLAGERMRMNTYPIDDSGYVKIGFELEDVKYDLTRKISKTPFIPDGKAQMGKRAEEILTIQSMGLKKRISHSRADTAVIGISGGLDSTLALLVTVRAFDALKKDRKNIIAVTMPCFGTTDRTYNNAVNFANSLGVTLKEVNIAGAVTRHFEDIGQDPTLYDVTFENSQARERTQVLMDIANQRNGLVVGTGDLSELALGWATYNGDHMSMYGVNASVPKTLIRYLVEYEAKRTDNDVLKITLEDILATPVSPELLPPKDGEIAQKTESIVGPYELHDFFIYYAVRCAFSPSKIYRLAKYAFDGQYDDKFILEWLRVFYRRFLSQQFKRSCVPDGPKVGTVALSPRGDWRMPSDACSAVWLDEVEKLCD